VPKLSGTVVSIRLAAPEMQAAVVMQDSIRLAAREITVLAARPRRLEQSPTLDTTRPGLRETHAAGVLVTPGLIRLEPRAIGAVRVMPEPIKPELRAIDAREAGYVPGLKLRTQRRIPS
jgi:hypothetical protein